MEIQHSHPKLKNPSFKSNVQYCISKELILPNTKYQKKLQLQHWLNCQASRLHATTFTTCSLGRCYSGFKGLITQIIKCISEQNFDPSVCLKSTLFQTVSNFLYRFSCRSLDGGTWVFAMCISYFVELIDCLTKDINK